MGVAGGHAAKGQVAGSGWQTPLRWQEVERRLGRVSVCLQTPQSLPAPRAGVGQGQSEARADPPSGSRGALPLSPLALLPCRASGSALAPGRPVKEGPGARTGPQEQAERAGGQGPVREARAAVLHKRLAVGGAVDLEEKLVVLLLLLQLPLQLAPVADQVEGQAEAQHAHREQPHIHP